MYKSEGSYSPYRLTPRLKLLHHKYKSEQMNFRLLYLLLIVCLIVPAVSSVENIIPKEGTVFVGEEDLDLSYCNVRAGEEIAWWSSGNPAGVPDARAKIGDVRRFYVDPTLFSSHSGTWYTLSTKETVFKVEEPWIQLEVVENGLDYDLDWIKQGNLISFKISTNMYIISERSGAAGVPVSINLTGPNNTVLTSVDSPQGEFNLNNIYVYYSPYDTGAAWETKDASKYPPGKWRAMAKINVNNIFENNEVAGSTYTDDVVFALAKEKPVKGEEEKESDENNNTTEEEKEVTKTPTETKTPTPTPTVVVTYEPPVITEVPTMITPEPIKPSDVKSEETSKASTSSNSSSSSAYPHPPKTTPKEQPLPYTLILAALGISALGLTYIRK